MKQIRLSKSTITQQDVKAVTKVLNDEYLGMGNHVKEFEEELTSFFNRPSICVNTGTAALQLAVQAVGIGLNDEVLVQSLTYVASFQAISATGAVAVACDVNPNNLTIDLIDAKSKLTAKTKAIMPMHYSGNPGDLDAIYIFAKENNLRVIEDAAHAFGSRYRGNKIGSQGDIVCFSFDGIKNITSGEGGAIVTNDKDILNKIKDIRLLGVEKDTDKRYNGQRSWDFDVTEQGWRYHMSNIMAAIGNSQLKRFEIIAEHRQKMAQLYKDELFQLKQVTLLNCDYNDVVPHLFVIRVHDGKRDKLKIHLEENGIQTGIHYKPNHLLSFYNNAKNTKLPITDLIYDEILSVPLHLDLDQDDVFLICNLIKTFFVG
jgi:dTDP-4-amino-4,6-dideoxygalactose transaminase